MPRHQTVDTSSPPTPEELQSLIAAVHHVCRREIDERLGVLGMSAVQWQALHVISAHPGLPQRQLARQMGQTEQAFGTLLGRLVTGFYLMRGRGAARAATHELTAHGRIMLQAAQEIAHDVLVLLFMPLTREETESLRVLLVKVLNARWRLEFHPGPEG